jgi:hypothetical protein
MSDITPIEPMQTITSDPISEINFWKQRAETAESALAEAQGVIAAARVSATGFITGLPDSDKRKGDLNRLADALVAYDSRHATQRKPSTGKES